MSHFLPSVFAVLAATTTTAKKSTSSGSAAFLIFIVIIGAALYFLFLRPSQQRARQQRTQIQAVGVGDEIVTAGGVVGRVVRALDDRVEIVSGGEERDATGLRGARMVVLRSSIARRLEPSPSAAAAEQDAEEPDGEETEEPDAEEETGT